MELSARSWRLLFLPCDFRRCNDFSYVGVVWKDFKGEACAHVVPGDSYQVSC